MIDQNNNVSLTSEHEKVIMDIAIDHVDNKPIDAGHDGDLYRAALSELAGALLKCPDSEVNVSGEQLTELMELITTTFSESQNTEMNADILNKAIEISGGLLSVLFEKEIPAYRAKRSGNIS